MTRVLARAGLAAGYGFGSMVAVRLRLEPRYDAYIRKVTFGHRCH